MDDLVVGWVGLYNRLMLPIFSILLKFDQVAVRNSFSGVNLCGIMVDSLVSVQLISGKY